MVRIRLRRVGSRKQASYRIVVTDKRSPRDGRYIEIIGFYNPRTQPETVEYQEDRALHWLNVGASPTEAVHRFFERYGTLARLKRLQQGEEMEVLVTEAETEKATREPISPKTKLFTAKSGPAVKQRVEAVAEAVAEEDKAPLVEPEIPEEDEAIAEDEVAAEED